MLHLTRMVIHIFMIALKPIMKLGISFEWIPSLKCLYALKNLRCSRLARHSKSRQFIPRQFNPEQFFLTYILPLVQGWNFINMILSLRQPFEKLFWGSWAQLLSFMKSTPVNIILLFLKHPKKRKQASKGWIEWVDMKTVKWSLKHSKNSIFGDLKKLLSFLFLLFRETIVADNRRIVLNVWCIAT